MVVEIGGGGGGGGGRRRTTVDVVVEIHPCRIWGRRCGSGILGVNSSSSSPTSVLWKVDFARIMAILL